jgi:hypothetical protein
MKWLQALVRFVSPSVSALHATLNRIHFYDPMYAVNDTDLPGA